MVVSTRGTEYKRGVRDGGRRVAQQRKSIWARHPEYTLLVGLALCLSFAIGMVALPATTAQLGYEIVSLQQELTRLERDAARLKLEVSRLESLERIEEVARVQLGMAEPEQVRSVMVAVPELSSSQITPAEATGSAAQRFTTGLVTFVARAVAGRPAQAGN